MRNADTFNHKFKKIALISLVVLLVLSILTSAFGIGVLALKKDDDAESASNNKPSSQTTSPEATYPTSQYEDLNNEIDLRDDVVILSEEESQLINSSIISAETVETYYDNYTNITIDGEDLAAFEGVSYGDIIYLQGDKNSPLGEDRFMKIDRISSYNDQTYLRVSEPYFEDVFDSMEYCASELLTEDNFVNAYYAEGVTSHFGSIDKEMIGVAKTEDLGNNGVVTLATDNVSREGDLILEIDFNLGKKDDDDKDDDDESALDVSYGIKGQFGIRDLAAHLVCDMPRAADFEELYFGLSGETFVDVDLYGKVSADAEAEASKKDLWLVSLEGLNEKRFPIAVFKFQGTTPVYITHAQFDKNKESILPSLYIIIYADWEGHISLEINGGFDYKHSFNGGLRVFKDGEPCLSFEKYPYTSAYDVEDEDGLVWNADITFDANTDLTLLGGSVVFYVAGINIGELSVARLGIEAQCNVSISADSKEGLKILDQEDTEFYLRGYLKFIEAKVKLKAEGKSFLKNLSVDIDFEFGLLDLTLFEHGLRPDKYRPKVPVSSMAIPDEFESVITLVCDVSGSMSSRIDSGQTKLEAAREAAKVIVTTTEDWSKNYEGNYGIGTIKFSSSAETVSLPHIDYKFINDCIDTFNDGGGTSIHSGIDAGTEQLKIVKAKNKIMILMTDGQDGNDSATLASARKAADEGIKIFVIGFGNDVNEEILKEIATETNGEYRFASTENIVGIMGSFMYAQQASTADVLAEMESSVSEGETSEAAGFIVDDKSGNLMVSTAWPGSFLDTILIDPNGRVVDETYPGAVTDESKIPSTITVKNPIKGEWLVQVKGVETSYEKEPFYTIVSFVESKNAKLNTKMSNMEEIAAYCTAIGLFATLTSAMFLLCFIKHRDEDDKITEEESV